MTNGSCAGHRSTKTNKYPVTDAPFVLPKHGPKVEPLTKAESKIILNSIASGMGNTVKPDSNPKLVWHERYHRLAKKVAYPDLGAIDRNKKCKFKNGRDEDLISMYQSKFENGIHYVKPTLGSEGFSMTLFKPKGKDAPPVLAFMGTQNVHGVLTDLKSKAPGWTQFEKNIKTIRWGLKELGNKYGPMVLTGHSLGGALAQFTAVHFAKEKYKFLEVVTFQTAGVDSATARKFERLHWVGGIYDKARISVYGVTHWMGRNDTVSRAGTGLLKGAIFEVQHKSKDKKGDIIGYHKMNLLVKVGARKVRPTGNIRQI